MITLKTFAIATWMLLAAIAVVTLLVGCATDYQIESGAWSPRSNTDAPTTMTLTRAIVHDPAGAIKDFNATLQTPNGYVTVSNQSRFFWGATATLGGALAAANGNPVVGGLGAIGGSVIGYTAVKQASPTPTPLANK